jgi:hypothetical protein
VVRTSVLVSRDDLPLLPGPEWREVYGHLRVAHDHLKAAEELRRRKGRRSPRITATWQWLEDLMRAQDATLTAGPAEAIGRWRESRIPRPSAAAVDGVRSRR